MYLLFAGDSYFPQGGMADLIFDSPKYISELKLHLERNKYDWWHIAEITDTDFSIVADQNGYFGSLESLKD